MVDLENNGTSDQFIFKQVPCKFFRLHTHGVPIKSLVLNLA